MLIFFAHSRQFSIKFFRAMQREYRSPSHPLSLLIFSARINLNKVIVLNHIQVSSEFEITYSDAALHLAELKSLETSLGKPKSSFNRLSPVGVNNQILYSTL